MKAPTYTDEQIIEAGMQLLAENKRVSPFAIRTLMGGGNPKRIKKIWSESESEALEGQMVREQVDLPTEFADALDATKLSLDELAKRMYNHAQEIAESRVRETITAARKAKESAEFDVAEAMDMVNNLDEEKQALTASFEKTWYKLEQANEENARLQERIDSLTQQATKDAEALKTAKVNNAELQKSNTTLAIQQELAVKQLEEVKQYADKTKSKLKETHTMLANVTLELATTQTDNTNLSTTLKALQTQSNKEQAKIEQLTTQNHQNETQLAVSTTKQEEAGERVKELVNKLESSRKAEEFAKREASELQGELKVLQQHASA